MAGSVAEGGHDTAGEVENDEEGPAEDVFDEGSGDEEEQQVPEEVHEVSVHEHRRQDIHPPALGGYVPEAYERELVVGVVEIRGQAIELLLLLADLIGEHRGGRLRVGHQAPHLLGHEGLDLVRDVQIGMVDVELHGRLPVGVGALDRGPALGDAHQQEDQDVEAHDRVGDPGVALDDRVVAADGQQDHDLARLGLKEGSIVPGSRG